VDPFHYPDKPHVRRHGPRGYADYESYRPWLRDEFAFRCVYCLLREQWGRVRRTFDLDHFRPAACHPHLALTYDNLLYACATCNAAKGVQDVPDPTRVFLHSAVQVNEDGTVQGHTVAARRLIRYLGLDAPESNEFRLLWLGILALAQRHDPALFRKLLGFPDDLPDLTRRRPPGGNTRPAGVRQSYLVQRRMGHLPEVY
jgi:hypothetical protein